MKISFYGTESTPLDYWERQQRANSDGVDLYVEQHFNASVNQSPDYTVVVVGSNASETSKAIGRDYARRVSTEFQTTIRGDYGILVGGFGGRGDGNIRKTNMPAVLLEPLFCSNPKQAGIIRSERGRQRLAQCLADTIRHFFKDDSHIGFSIGHKYKRSNPRDRGAAVFGGGTEADYAEKVMLLAAEMLSAPDDEKYVVVKGDTLWSISRKYGVSVEKLREWNRLEGNNINVGDELILQ